MENFKVNAKALAAASLTQAKNDIRFYLCGILIGDGKMVSTDGHRMTIVDCQNCEETKSMKPKIFKLYGKVPSSAYSANFVFTEDDRGVIYFTNGKAQELNKVIKFELIHGRYPDYKKVTPSGKRTKVEEIAFNLDYLSEAEKIGKCLGKNFNAGRFEIFGEKGMITIASPGLEAKYIVMSVKP